MFAAKNKLDNLIGIVDWNNRQIDGDVSDIMGLENLDDIWALMDGVRYTISYNRKR